MSKVEEEKIKKINKSTELHIKCFGFGKKSAVYSLGHHLYFIFLIKQTLALIRLTLFISSPHFKLPILPDMPWYFCLEPSQNLWGEKTSPCALRVMMDFEQLRVKLVPQLSM